jgi:opacity protein-like surface antigen
MRVQHTGTATVALLPIALHIAIAVSSVAASAEGFIDIYGGASIPENVDLDTEIDVDLAGFSASATDELDYDTSAVVGVRGGYWFPDFSFFGLALDASYFMLEAPSASARETIDGNDIEIHGDPDIDVYPITPLLMLRSKVLTIGRTHTPGFQPYIGIGPGIFLSVMDDSLDIRINGEEDSFEAVSVDVGLDARAGLKIHLTRWLTLFTEYRFTYFEPSFEDDLFDDVLSVKQEAELRTHHVVGGVGFHF